MTSLTRILCSLLLFGLTSGLAQAGLTPFNVVLEATKFGTVNLAVRGEQSLLPNPNGSWTLTLTNAHPLVSVLEQSTFAWQDDRSLPMSYYSKVRIGLSTKIRSMAFNRAKSEIVIKDRGSELAVKWDADQVDLGSFQINLIQFLTQTFGDRAFTDITSMMGEAEQYRFSQQIQDWDKQSPLTFSIIATEILATKAGLLNTLLLEEHNAQRPHVLKRYWVAADYGFIPVRVDQYRHGKIESRIEVLSGDYGGQAITGLPPLD